MFESKKISKMLLLSSFVSVISFAVIGAAQVAEAVKSPGAWNGSSYIKESESAQVKGAKNLIDTMIMPELKKMFGEHSEREINVLDIGCGSGNATSYLASEVAKIYPNGHVLGIDIENSMLQAARERYADISNLSFELGNALAFNYSEKFDVIMSCNALHWVDDHATVLRNVYKSLKPGGIFAMVKIGGTAPYYYEELAQTPRWLGKVSTVKRYYPKNAEIYAQFLGENGGFEIIRCEVLKKACALNGADMYNWLRMMVTAFTGLTDEQEISAFTTDQVAMLKRDVEHNGGSRAGKLVRPEDNETKLVFLTPMLYVVAKKKIN